MGNNLISEEVAYIVGNVLNNEGFEKARKELMKLYLKYYSNLTNIEDKRLILNYLMFTEKNLGLIDMVKIHSEELKKDMDNEPYYLDDFPEYYIEMKKYYNMSHVDLEVPMMNKRCTKDNFKIIREVI